MSPTPLLEVWHYCLHAIEHGLEDNSNYLVKFLVRQFHHRFRYTTARIVDPHMHVSKSFERDVSQMLDIFSPSNVSPHGNSIRSDPTSNPFQLILSSRTEHKPVPLCSQMFCQCFPDSTASSSYHGHFFSHESSSRLESSFFRIGLDLF